MNDFLEKRFSKLQPDGDTQARDVCDRCGFVDYQNPKIVVGSVVEHDGRIMLCRRAIEPRYGYWTVPAGYLELGETPVEGAKREAFEEANATLELHELMAVYTVRRLSQVQLIYRASLAAPDFSAGEESLDVQLFEWPEIPWDELAFPTVRWMLDDFSAWKAGKRVLPTSNPTGADEDLRNHA
ncbi:MAG: NUDIX domain-containing protein [Pseudomonadota bacterium]